MIKQKVSKYAIATFVLPLNSLLLGVILHETYYLDFAELLDGIIYCLFAYLWFIYSICCWFSSAPLGIKAFAEMKEKKCKGKTLAIIGLILGMLLPIWLIVVLQLCGANLFGFASD